MQKKENYFWLHSLTLVIFVGFSGGFIAPMLIGRIPFPLTNDLIVPLCVIMWYFINNFDTIYQFLMLPQIRLVMICYHFCPINVLWEL
jgi:hypothetical protein